jgi:beta-carotene ketolase (CrtO type)
MDKEYDVVIVGGGHHATVIAPYLAKAGMKVAVFEKNDRFGGGAVTDIGPTQGYKMAFCSEGTRFYAHPAFKDFNLYDEGLHYVAPETGAGAVFDDGTSLMTYPVWILTDPRTGAIEYREDNLKKTYDQIAQFSKTDAETYLYLTEKFEKKWAKAFSKDRYSLKPATGPSILEQLLSDPDFGLDPEIHYMSVKQVAHYLFESPELVMFFLRVEPSTFGGRTEDVIGIEGIIGTLSVMFTWSPPSIAVGGSQPITDALVSAGKKLGVEYFTHFDVEKIIVKNGKACGISNKKGTGITAKELVVVDVGYEQLLERFLGKEYIDSDTQRRLRAIDHDRNQIISGAVAVHELPDYVAARSNPDVNRCYRLYHIPKDLSFIKDRYWPEILLFGLPNTHLSPFTIPDSIWDRSRAPEGKHVVWFEEFTVPIRYLPYREWRRIREEFVDERLLPEWQGYAPNMTKENIIASRTNTPVEYESVHPDMREGGFGVGAMIISQAGWLRGIPRWRFSTPLKGLYICSSAGPGGQGIARGSSYRCYQQVAEDYGLSRFTLVQKRF